LPVMKSLKFPIAKYFLLYFVFLTAFIPAISQTLGGNSAYNFLKLPNTPQLSALGGINISNISNDAGMAFNNPSLLRSEMHQQLHVSFNNMYAGIKNYHSYFAYHYNKWQTNFGAGVYYLDYGTLIQTDASGNISGSFHPNDYVLQISASRKYMEKWYYGATFKFISSNYGFYRSNAIAMDFGISYYDTTRLLQASLVFKNMGTQLKKYENSKQDDLPFDMELGLTKRLARAPIQFSVTAHHLQQFNIRYSDSTFNNNNGFEQNANGKSFTVDKIFRHFILAAQVYAGSKIEITVAYNYLLRKELIIANTTNGFTGFSFGAGALFKKIQIRYARSYYQNNTGYNQLGLNLLFSNY
jgi:hypothetical protein